MTMMNRMITGGVGLAALAATAPAAAQYSYPYAYSGATNMAAQRCTAAVQNRLSSRGGLNIFGIMIGANDMGRVLNVTQVIPRRNSVRVRGLATTGRVAYYDPYGVRRLWHARRQLRAAS